MVGVEDLSLSAKTAKSGASCGSPNVEKASMHLDVVSAMLNAPMECGT